MFMSAETRGFLIGLVMVLIALAVVGLFGYFIYAYTTGSKSGFAALHEQSLFNQLRGRT
jgi:hypothetical protein